MTNSILWGTVGLAVTWVIVLVLYDIPGVFVLNMTFQTQSRRLSEWTGHMWALRPHWDGDTLVKLARVTLPLGVATMLISLHANMPRYFIERYLGDRELGFFAAMAYLTVAGTTVVNALGQSASPRLAKFYATGNSNAFCKLLLKLVGLSVLLGIGGILVALVAGREILSILYQPEYGTYADVFVWLMVITAVNYVASLLGYGMTASHYYRVQPVIFAATTLFALLLSFALVPIWGVLGAVGAMGLSLVFQAGAVFVCNVHAVNKLNKQRKLYVPRGA
jgi:O-antigen/teichoic acid export membrane protein